MYRFYCASPGAHRTHLRLNLVLSARLGLMLAMLNCLCACGGHNTSTLTIPSAPSGLSASAGNGQVALSWSASDRATGYRVYRSTSSGAESFAATAATTAFTDPGLTNSTAYYYQVTAVNSAGESGKSNEVKATPTAPSMPTLNPVYGLNFSPYVNQNQDPNIQSSAQVSSAQINSLLQTMKGYTQWIRTFGTQNGLENIPAKARQQGFKTAIGAYIGSDTTVNNAQIANLIAAAKAGNVDIAIVGNETLLNNTASEDQLIAYIKSVKSQVPAGVQVTYADTWNTIVAHPQVIAAVDVVAVNIYPFYENAAIDQALSKLQADYMQTVQAANGKQVIITETGWPSSGSPVSFSPAAIPSAANATTYFNAVETWARGANVPMFYFEAFDEFYKSKYNDFPSWGIWDANSNLKPGISAVFQ